MSEDFARVDENGERSHPYVNGLRSTLPYTPCPYCGAEPGHPCVSQATGAPVAAGHAARLALSGLLGTTRRYPITITLGSPQVNVTVDSPARLLRETP